MNKIVHVHMGIHACANVHHRPAGVLFHLWNLRRVRTLALATTGSEQGFALEKRWNVLWDAYSCQQSLEAMTADLHAGTH